MSAAPDDQFEFTAADGLLVRVRPEQESDAPHLVNLFSSLSPDSRFLRFSKSMASPDPELVRREAERLSRLGPPHDMAWLAFADLPGQSDAPIAAVRFDAVAPGTAELAITVRDDVQRRGIGTALLAFACEQARRQGLQRLVAVFRSENKAIWSLVRHSPYPTRTRINGPEISAEIDLAAGPAASTG